jgi:hypothetical protein
MTARLTALLVLLGAGAGFGAGVASRGDSFASRTVFPAAPIVDPTDREIQAVTRLERQFGEAITRHDSLVLDTLMAAEFLSINPAAHVLDKAGVYRELTNLDYQLISVVNDSITIRRFGDLAVATTRGTARGVANGQEVTGQLRLTRIWLKRDGHWRAVGGQATAIP